MKTGVVIIVDIVVFVSTLLATLLYIAFDKQHTNSNPKNGDGGVNPTNSGVNKGKCPNCLPCSSDNTCQPCPTGPVIKCDKMHAPPTDVSNLFVCDQTKGWVLDCSTLTSDGKDLCESWKGFDVPIVDGVSRFACYSPEHNSLVRCENGSICEHGNCIGFPKGKKSPYYAASIVFGILASYCVFAVIRSITNRDLFIDKRKKLAALIYNEIHRRKR